VFSAGTGVRRIWATPKLNLRWAVVIVRAEVWKKIGTLGTNLEARFFVWKVCGLGWGWGGGWRWVVVGLGCGWFVLWLWLGCGGSLLLVVVVVVVS